MKTKHLLNKTKASPRVIKQMTSTETNVTKETGIKKRKHEHKNKWMTCNIISALFYTTNA